MRLLPRETLNSTHETLISALVDGSISWEEAALYFHIPGMGFHQSAYLLTLHTAEYRRFGRQIIGIPKEMQVALQRTALSEISPEELCSPYQSLYMALPDSDCRLWGGPRTGWHQIGGVYVRYVIGGGMSSMDVNDLTLERHDAHPANAVLQLFLWGMENAKSEGRGDDANFWFTVDLREMKERGLDLESYVELILRDPSRDASTEEFTELGKSFMGAFSLREMPDKAMKNQIQNVKDVVRIVMNAVIYMNTEDADIQQDETAAVFRREREETEKALARLKNPNKAKGRRLARKLAEIPSDNIVWIGRNIRGPQTVQDQEAWVRGHWWPRKKTTARKLEHRTKDLVEQQATLELKREALRNATGIEEIAQRVCDFQEAQQEVETTQGVLNALEQDCEGKRRWVRPQRTSRDPK